jgi:hypothetical protein
MSDFVTRYEQQFRDAANRQFRRRLIPRFSRRASRVIVVGVAALAAVGVPAAAQSGWFPFAGRADAPSTTSLSPSEALRGTLSVLQRPQTAADRQAAGYALDFFGRTFHGVQADYIRSANVGPGNEVVVLVPVESHQLTPDSPLQRDVICLWRTDFSRGAPDGGDRGCFQSTQIAAGQAVQSLGHRFDMLVPDGVARVEAAAADGSSAASAPTDNVASWAGPRPTRITWYGDDGGTIRTIRR